MGKRILVIGKSGREHALIWKVVQSPEVEKTYCVPGNAGTEEITENVNIKSFTKPEDIDNLAKLAEQLRIDLTVVGPEEPYVNGIVDEFRKRGLPIFGPSQKASKLEGSKIFSQDIKSRYRIPTPLSYIFYNDQHRYAIRFLRSMWDEAHEYVIKADGLASGKGVFLDENVNEACRTVSRLMKQKELGEEGKDILIQERLYGWELSSIGLTDGATYLPLEHTQDHKRIGDNDTGPNTGGMGAYSPVPSVSRELDSRIRKDVMIPTIEAMSNEDCQYKGVLYAGLIITDNIGEERPINLEYNIRFGDPETQPLMMRMKSDLVPYLFACTDGTLNRMNPIKWDDKWAVCVVLASKGYPSEPEIGKMITGLDEVKRIRDVFVFHGGTRKEDGKVYTDGGRILGVTALGYGKEVIERLYEDVLPRIHFDGMYYRKDIGRRALNVQGV